MEQETIIAQMKTCAELLYQNQEREAYRLLPELMECLKQLLQVLAEKAPEKAMEFLQVFKEFIIAYQINDNLAMADLLSVDLASEIGKL